MSEEVIIIENVWKYYNSHIALKGVSLTIRRGEIFGLLGPNGAGKTTLLNIMVGLIKPSRGRVFIEGKDVFKEFYEIAKDIVFMPQEYAVYDNLTGIENIVFFASLHGISRKEAKERGMKLLEVLGLKNFAKKLVKKYSGGMKRKLALACALVVQPKILVLDEPTTGLDPAIRRDIWDMLRNYAKSGGTVVMATHYMEEAEALCTRVAIMDLGEVKAIDTPENLKRILGPYSIVEVEVKAEYIANSIEEVLKPFSETGEVYVSKPFYSIPTKSPEAIIPRVLYALEKEGIPVARVSLRKPTLEDVFIKLTGRRLGE